MPVVVSSLPSYKIMLVDDHQLMLDGIESLLTKHFSVTIVSRVSNGLEVYSECQKTMPDMILMDLSLPGMNGIDVIARVKQHWPRLSILVLTANKIFCNMHQAFAAGAQAYVLKQSKQEVLFSAFKAVMSGKRFIDPNLNTSLIDTQPNSEKNLTRRELQILKLVAEGYKNREMADRLSISIKTVETHRLNLMKKLDVHNVAGMVAWSTRLGLVEAF